MGREGKISIQKREAREGGALEQNPAEFSLVRHSKLFLGLGEVPRLAPGFPIGRIPWPIVDFGFPSFLGHGTLEVLL